MVRINRETFENSLSRSADYIFRFNKNLSQEPFSKLRLVIGSNKPILVDGGKFSEDDLQGYLDLWEGLNDIYVNGLIDKDMFYSSYSYDIGKAYDHKEVKKFVEESQREAPELEEARKV